MQTHCNSPESGDAALKNKLRSLRDIPVPNGLKERLFETIPNGNGRNVRWSFYRVKTWQMVTAAAVVMFATVLFVKNSGLSPFSARLIAEVNETSQKQISTDQNSVTDINEANSISRL